MIAVAREPRGCLRTKPEAQATLRRILADEGLRGDAAARAFARATGITLTRCTMDRWARRWKLPKQRRNEPPGRVRETMRRLLIAGMTLDGVRDALRDSFGVGISRKTVAYYRDLWAIRKPVVSALPAKACDLCGQPAAGRLRDGARWQLEGEVCGQCAAELEAEATAAYRARRREQVEAAKAERRAAKEAEEEARWIARAQARQAADTARNAEAQARARLVHAEVFGLPIATCRECRGRQVHFTADDLRGPALTHWLKTMLRRDPLALLLAS